MGERGRAVSETIDLLLVRACRVHLLEHDACVCVHACTPPELLEQEGKREKMNHMQPVSPTETKPSKEAQREET